MVSPAFASVIGQTQAVTLLSQAIARDRIAPAYLFAGVPGVGRGLTARCFATELLGGSPAIDRVNQGNHPDLLWVEPTYLHQGKRISAAEATEMNVKRKAAPQIRLEQIREITVFLSRPPLEAKRSIVVIEQAETMAEPAANGLLKTLEEPGRATMILIAPSVESLLPTLVSRCQVIPFIRLSQAAIAQILQRNGQTELFQLSDVMTLAQGSVSSAIEAHQQLERIPAELQKELLQPPRSPRQALELARQVAQLDLETQLWLIDYLQQRYWQLGRPKLLQVLETTRRSLQAFAQARLVWEVTFLQIST
ncbi:DNA polymerase III subunit delta' [Microcoleus sp. FACHB-1515]|uniref:DNA polymerase III subunit delta' n=1 Tax=Cyanophyceae TaxID=3028117 RepID=UPI001688657C|nr:DNA polymerase III subunit delta' [Microcoleus sp. FACHB-1515]MBD2089602.1 DNA polymerase III subunit delta' [Microcoleus sp. FACHB-1515]